MATTTSKSVNRQATFDTDPSRAPLAHGNLKLPVIETQAKDKTNNTSDKEDSKHRTTDKQEKQSLNNKHKETTDTSPKDHDTAKKLNALSNINKKVKTGHSPVEVPKDDKVLVPSPKISNQHGDSKKTQENNTKKKADHSKHVVISPVHKSTVQQATISQTTSQNKENVKGVETRKNATENKHETNKLAESNTNKRTKHEESVRNTDHKDKQTLEKVSINSDQKVKASLLNDLNKKRSVSPVKKSVVSPRKEADSHAISDNIHGKTGDKKVPDEKAKDANHKLTPKQKQDSENKKQSPRTNYFKHEKQSVNKENLKSLKDDDKKNKDSKTVEIKGRTKEQGQNKTTSLPTNKAPAETHLAVTETKEFHEPKTVSATPKNVTADSKPNVLANSKQVDRSSPDKTKHVGGVPEELQQKSENEPSHKSHDKHDLTINENLDALKEIPKVNVISKTDSSTDANKILSTSVQSKNETYVLSPSTTKFDQRSQRNGKLFGPSRLSPSNESVEPIKLEPKPHLDKTSMDGDRRESYAQVYAERGTLLKAEYTYRKRIKQLEDEANGFLKAIEELTSENKYLRGRADALEYELQNKGDVSAVDKISTLEKDRIELESRIRQMEKDAKDNDTTEELRGLKELVVKLQSDNQVLHENNSKLRIENEEHLKKIHSLEKERKSVTSRVTAVESEETGKDYKKTNKQINELEAKNQALEKKVDALEYENKALSDTLTQKKTELNELLGVMKDENKFDNEIKELKNQVLKLNKENKEAELAFNKEKRSLNDRLKSTKDLLEAKSKEGDELKIKLDEAEAENKKMKGDLDPMKRQLENQKKDISRLRDENERLKQELKTTKDNYTKLEHESESTLKEGKEAKSKLEMFNKDLQKIVSDKESQISKLINQLDTMREERERERKATVEEKEKMATELEKLEAYQTTIARLEEDNKHFIEKLDESKLKERQLNLNLEDKGFLISNLEQQVFEMNMKMENYSKRMSELDKENREMEREKREWDVKKDKIDDIEASNKRLLEENKRLRNQIEVSSYLNTYRPPPSLERPTDEKPVLEAWISTDKNVHSQPVNHAVYVQKEKEHKRKKVHLVQPQPSVQKKRMPFSKSSPVKELRQRRKEESKSSNPSTHRSLEDLRKVADNKTPESEHSLPELRQDARLTIPYAGFGGYREIHKNRIRAAAYKKVF